MRTLKCEGGGGGRRWLIHRERERSCDTHGNILATVCTRREVLSVSRTEEHTERSEIFLRLERFGRLGVAKREVARSRGSDRAARVCVYLPAILLSIVWSFPEGISVPHHHRAVAGGGVASARLASGPGGPSLPLRPLQTRGARLPRVAWLAVSLGAHWPWERNADIVWTVQLYIGADLNSMGSSQRAYMQETELCNRDRKSTRLNSSHL